MPLGFADQRVDEIVMPGRLMKLEAGPRDLRRWSNMLTRMRNPDHSVKIGLVGKYVSFEDAYKSLKEALLHGGLSHGVKLRLNGFGRPRNSPGRNASAPSSPTTASWCRAAFRQRGIGGMLAISHPLRPAEFKVPYFGICLGMQTMVIEFARNVCGLASADSTPERSGRPPSRDL